jgi:hypothetical protein
MKPESPTRLARLSAVFVLTLSAVLESIASAPESISGIVRDPQGLPVQGVSVAIVGIHPSSRRTVYTGQDGVFAAGDLANGYYTVFASKPGFVPSGYGSAWAGDPGNALAIQPGHKTPEVSVVLRRGASLRGSLTDQQGQPIQGMRVSLFQLEQPGFPFRVLESAAVESDDEGRFRFWGLPGAEYLLAASDPQRERPRRFASAAGGRGAAVASDTYSYRTQFYPGTPEAADANVIRLEADSEVKDVALSLSLQREQTIAGSVTGMPPGSTLHLSLSGSGPLADRFSVGTTTSMVSPDGRFSVGGVRPGKYRLIAQAASATATQRSAPRVWAGVELEVSDQPISGIALHLEPMSKIAGRAVFEPLGKDNPDVSAFQIAVTDTARSTSPRPTQLLHLRSDGTLSSQELAPGTYILSGGPPLASGWWLRSATVDGIDALDDPIRLAAAGSKDIALKFSNLHSEVRGYLRSSDGAPLFSDYSIVIFPAGSDQWRVPSRRIRILRPATDGYYSAADLPGGQYLVAVVSPAARMTSTLFRTLASELKAAAIGITIGDGQKRVQDLVVTR